MAYRRKARRSTRANTRRAAPRRARRSTTVRRSRSGGRSTRRSAQTLRLVIETAPAGIGRMPLDPTTGAPVTKAPRGHF